MVKLTVQLLQYFNRQAGVGGSRYFVEVAELYLLGLLELTLGIGAAVEGVSLARSFLAHAADGNVVAEKSTLDEVVDVTLLEDIVLVGVDSKGTVVAEVDVVSVVHVDSSYFVFAG